MIKSGDIDSVRSRVSLHIGHQTPDDKDDHFNRNFGHSIRYQTVETIQNAFDNLWLGFQLSN